MNIVTCAFKMPFNNIFQHRKNFKKDEILVIGFL
jgi:hypothetical protein